MAAGEAAFDYGAQYFTARDPAFSGQVKGWLAEGKVARWPAAGAEAWVGVPAMNAPLKALAHGLDIRWSTTIEAIRATQDGWRVIAGDVDDERFNAAILAVPAEQAAALLGPIDQALAAEVKATPSAPCWTLMTAFNERLAVGADVISERQIISWAARNSAKPGRSGPESWVIHASATWSADHLENDQLVIVREMLRAFAQATGIPLPEPLVACAHRWRYAKSGKLGRDFCWDERSRLGVCGDWLLCPRVECAWLSGDRLAKAIGS